MKKIALFSLVAALLLGGGSLSTASAQLRIGTVDMKRVFEGYYKSRDAEQHVGELRDKLRKELEDRAENYRRAVAEVQKLEQEFKRPELSAAAREVKQKEGVEKVSRLNATQRDDTDFRQAREKELQDLSMKLRNEIVDDITRIVNERAKTEPFDLVLDRGGISLNSVPVVLYAKDSYDFTTDVLTALNKTKGAPVSVKAPTVVRPPEVARPVATPKKPK